MEPKVPTSNPVPKIELYKEDEKKDEIRNITGITAPIIIKRSLGILILPSPNLAINQKESESVAPIEIKKALLASVVTGIKGTKKKMEINNVMKSVNNDKLLKSFTFFVCIFFIFCYILIIILLSHHYTL